MEITIVAHVQTENQNEVVVDLAISELIDFNLARDFQVKKILRELGHTNVAPVPTDQIDVFTATSTFEGQEVTTKVVFRKALRAGNIGSKSGDSFFELNELTNVVNK